MPCHVMLCRALWCDVMCCFSAVSVVFQCCFSGVLRVCCAVLFLCCSGVWCSGMWCSCSVRFISVDLIYFPFLGISHHRCSTSWNSGILMYETQSKPRTKHTPRTHKAHTAPHTTRHTPHIRTSITLWTHAVMRTGDDIMDGTRREEKRGDKRREEKTERQTTTDNDGQRAARIGTGHGTRTDIDTNTDMHIFLSHTSVVCVRSHVSGSKSWISYRNCCKCDWIFHWILDFP